MSPDIFNDFYQFYKNKPVIKWTKIKKHTMTIKDFVVIYSSDVFFPYSICRYFCSSRSVKTVDLLLQKYQFSTGQPLPLNETLKNSFESIIRMLKIPKI